MMCIEKDKKNVIGRKRRLLNKMGNDWMRWLKIEVGAKR